MYYYLFVLLLLFLAELLYFKVADRYDIIDKPNERSSHRSVTLRGGGVVFYLGALAYLVWHPLDYVWFALGLSLLAVVSFIDDIAPLSQKVRLSFHFVAMALLFYQLDMLVYPWWYVFIALIVCTGIVNAYNFMDGINGITGGYSLAVLTFLAYINQRVTVFIDPAFIYTVAIAVVVFNFFNFRTRAKCFAGDVGSVCIAFVLLFFTGRLMIFTGDISYILLFAVYGVDSVLTIVHRLLLGENIGLPHRKHLYQLLSNELRIPHLVTSALYMMLQSIVMVGFFLLYAYRYIYLVGIILIMSAGYYLFMKKYYHLHTSPEK
jgi:UDP-N-acetylmuramyl pentapeptide phosphotransferase/UDP-N-acetylglucosamine-1-phosphate transferase